MRIVESWLREWVNPELDMASLAHQLTMAGHEVDRVISEGTGLVGIVIAEVQAVENHPDADRLSVCKVSDGKSTVDVVCGAPNVRAGMKSPLAAPGVLLPNGVELKKAKIRGVFSNGMLCSAAEIGLGDESDGIIELPADAPIGQPLVDYLNLPDRIIDLDITPNRGDCFSVLGIARDVSALTGAALKDSKVNPVPATIDDVHLVELPVPEGCPSFAGRVIRHIDPAARTPMWMTERLRRAGLRPINPVVDVTNYVMLELGQPLHAYDLRHVSGPIRPRFAVAGENLELLDGKEIAINDDTLVISDDTGAIGLAGIMGGLSTAVSDVTTDVFFEAAFWPPEFVAGRARSYGMHTDASLRFERGVDPNGQERSVERATELLLLIAGGQAGPLVMATAAEHQPKRKKIELRRSRIARLLGIEIKGKVITGILERLGLAVTVTDNGWEVTAPGYRFDIEIEVDLIEEVARIYGYDEIPETTSIAETPLEAVPESKIAVESVANILVARDYQEVVTYSFIDAESNTALSGVDSELVLSNPISSEMSVMRASLWPGMLAAAATNLARQQDRVRLFEIGKTFHGKLGNHTEIERVAGVAIGPVLPEQWATKSQSIDFFDIKSDVEALLKLTGATSEFDFVPAEHPALQPGQAANIIRNDVVVGRLGKLHPRHVRSLDLKHDVFVFELDAAIVFVSDVPRATLLSKYPSIRRDIAVVVNEKISAHDLVRAAVSAAPELISNVRIFDVYQGPGIEAGLKSVALGLILQETSRTLTDIDADSAMTAAVRKLQDEFAAQLRD